MFLRHCGVAMILGSKVAVATLEIVCGRVLFAVFAEFLSVL